MVSCNPLSKIPVRLYRAATWLLSKRQSIKVSDQTRYSLLKFQYVRRGGALASVSPTTRFELCVQKLYEGGREVDVATRRSGKLLERRFPLVIWILAWNVLGNLEIVVKWRVFRNLIVRFENVSVLSSTKRLKGRKKKKKKCNFENFLAFWQKTK